MTVSGRPVFARVGYGEASARRYVCARDRSHRPPRMWVWRSFSDPGRRDARRYFRRRAVEGSRPLPFTVRPSTGRVHGAMATRPR